ncbi:ArsR/SmtB family transcription factor [Robinsoniella peoriensis]|uniref:Bacterial regulatory protein, arsR family n=1 Tax=Robinsoniella peoriensis TaxID=180332 RepID=A0A4U8Q702_9FIRM|nr:metalloregulator ArsR/SmtB family transcription factor [Robinsoniella peoriensis]MDU7026268.1 metalloregulator ArsR/SmtB family transcription factor [Clostridiales bacterium]TLD00682.1 Bacterial regulatory protein, arsR family [Robinsoniella peoriensis]
MSMIMKNELDPVFETLGLLCSCYQSEETRDETIKELNEIGIDGEAFYQKHFKILERYEKYFKDHYVKTENEEFFFKDKDQEWILILIVSVTENKEWIQSLDGVTDKELRDTLMSIIIDDGVNSEELSRQKIPCIKNELDIIEFLEPLDMDEGKKWHLLKFLHRPRFWMEYLMEAIRKNIPVYEKALASVEKPLQTLLERYAAHKVERFDRLFTSFLSQAVVYPTLVAPAIQLILYSHGYQGLFLELLPRRGKSTDAAKDAVIMKLKALSDRSKLDILCILKESKKYNLELAGTMKLSASTMSHHMNVLFSCGLVNIEKKNGKVYYCLEEDAVMDLIGDLKQLLL